MTGPQEFPINPREKYRTPSDRLEPLTRLVESSRGQWEQANADPDRSGDRPRRGPRCRSHLPG
ncbi:MAG TPA: hypothetical protein VFY98_11065 [Intrasporangium sp.]|nr:hypothetical protein [Intrasporangium sp.]